MLCAKCDKRADCKALCDAAETYVNQDHRTFPGVLYLRDQTVPHPGPVEIYKDADTGQLTETGWSDMQGEGPALTGSDWQWLVSNVKLTLFQYAALNLYYWRGLTLRQAAELLGINSTTAKKHIDKAKLKIIEYLWVITNAAQRRGEEIAHGQKALVVSLLHAKRKFTPFYLRTKQDDDQGAFQLCL